MLRANSRKNFSLEPLLITLEKILMNHNAIILPSRYYLLGQID